MLNTRRISAWSTFPRSARNRKTAGVSQAFQSISAFDVAGQRAHEVAREPAPGDVGHAGDDLLDLVRPLRAHDGLGVDPRGGQQHLAQRLLGVEIGIGLGELEAAGR
jgi:hypothetical protein